MSVMNLARCWVALATIVMLSACADDTTQTPDAGQNADAGQCTVASLTPTISCTVLGIHQVWPG
jgi:hypothetical protein